MATKETNVLTVDERGNSYAIPTVRFLNTTSTGLVKSEAGTVSGVIVNSHTSGTIKFSNGTTAVNDIMGTYTFPAGSQVVTFPGGVVCSTGIFVTIGGTANVTICYN